MKIIQDYFLKIKSKLNQDEIWINPVSTGMAF